MTRLSTILAVMLFVTAAAGGSAYADRTGQNWLSQEEVTKRITESGYSHVTRLEPEEDCWQGKGLRDGKLMVFKADPHTGEILEEEFDD